MLKNASFTSVGTFCWWKMCSWRMSHTAPYSCRKFFPISLFDVHLSTTPTSRPSLLSACASHQFFHICSGCMWRRQRKCAQPKGNNDYMKICGLCVRAIFFLCEGLQPFVWQRHFTFIGITLALKCGWAAGDVARLCDYLFATPLKILQRRCWKVASNCAPPDRTGWAPNGELRSGRHPLDTRRCQAIETNKPSPHFG